MLVEPTINILKLHLVPEEREAYNNILEFHNRAIDISVSGKSPASINCSTFQALLELRIFCNNGLYKGRDSRVTHTNHFNLEEYFTFLRQNDKARCVRCNNEVLFLGESELSDTGRFAECLHLICGPCAKSTRSYATSTSKKLECPIWNCSQLPGSPPKVLSSESLSSIDHAAHQTSEEMFSTKFRAFLRAILGHIPQEKGYGYDSLFVFQLRLN